MQIISFYMVQPAAQFIWLQEYVQNCSSSGYTLMPWLFCLLLFWTSRFQWSFGLHASLQVALDPESNDVAVDCEKTLHMYPFLSELKKMNYFGWLLKRSWQFHFLPLFRLAGVWSLHQFFIQTSHILPACTLLLVQIAIARLLFLLIFELHHFIVYLCLCSSIITLCVSLTFI